jgi:protein-S-isoprenylcysteine O-methyltransferase Ste14
MLEAALFLVGSLGLIWVSRASLRHPRSHGFYRFFAWELLLALFLLNARKWFYRPFTPHQLVSWLLLCVSLFLVLQGVDLLRRRGALDERRDDAALLGMEKTTALITSGVYAYIRHPLYSSLLFLGWGIFFKSPSWPGGLLALAATGFLALTARAEEAENLRYFGPAYADYRARTKMFLPYLF